MEMLRTKYSFVDTWDDNMKSWNEDGNVDCLFCPNQKGNEHWKDWLSRWMNVYDSFVHFPYFRSLPSPLDYSEQDRIRIEYHITLTYSEITFNLLHLMLMSLSFRTWFEATFMVEIVVDKQRRWFKRRENDRESGRERERKRKEWWTKKTEPEREAREREWRMKVSEKRTFSSAFSISFLLSA